MTSLEILDNLIRYVRLREDLHIVLALERRAAGCRQCRSTEDPRVAGDLLGAGPTARRLLRRRRAAQSPRLPLLKGRPLRVTAAYCSKVDSGKPLQGAFMSSRPSVPAHSYGSQMRHNMR